MARPPLPAPEKRSNRFTIHLDDESAERLRRIARLQRRPPGRLATLLVEDATLQLDSSTAAAGGCE